MTTIADINVEQDYIVVVQNKIKHTRTAGGIILNEIDKFKDTLNGKVVKVSEHSPYPLQVAVGDVVYFTELGVKSKVHLGGVEYLFIKESEALGYLSDD